VIGVFEDFLKTLASDPTIDQEVTQRLRETLLEDEGFSADSLRSALFSEESLP
jgi:hypothetical protein